MIQGETEIIINYRLALDNNLLAEGSLEGAAVGEFSGGQSSVQLQEFSAPAITATQSGIQRSRQFSSTVSHYAIHLRSVINQNLMKRVMQI